MCISIFVVSYPFTMFPVVVVITFVFCLPVSMIVKGILPFHMPWKLGLIKLFQQQYAFLNCVSYAYLFIFYSVQI